MPKPTDEDRPGGGKPGGGGGGGGGKNVAPEFTTTSFNVDENTASSAFLLAGSDYSTDANGDNLSYSIAGGADASLFSIDASTGELTFASNFHFDHEYKDAYEVEISVADRKLSASHMLTITVNDVNEAPIAVPDSFIVAEGQVTTLDLLANDSDPDAGDSLRIAVVETSGGVFDNFRFEDGQLVFDATDGFDWLGDGESSTFSIDYIARDDDGLTSRSTAEITVTGVNDAPESGSETVEILALEDAVSPTIHTTGVIDVTGSPELVSATSSDHMRITSLLNDVIDPDGDTLSIDLDSVELISGRDDTWTLEADGTLLLYTMEYEMQFGERESIEISYNVIDGNGGVLQQTALIWIDGVNDAPVLSPDPEEALTASSVSGQISFTDVDGGNNDSWFLVDPDATVVFDPFEHREVTEVTLDYGTVGIMADGSWEFVFDFAAIASIPDGQTDIDEFRIYLGDFEDPSAPGSAALGSITLELLFDNSGLLEISYPTPYDDGGIVSPDGTGSIGGIYDDTNDYDFGG